MEQPGSKGGRFLGAMSLPLVLAGAAAARDASQVTHGEASAVTGGILVGGAILVVVIFIIGHRHAHARFGSFPEPLRGRLGLLWLRFERAGFKFVATAELFGRINVACRRFKTRHSCHLRPVRSRSWPAPRTTSLDADLDARFALSDELRPVIHGDEGLEREIIRLDDRFGLRFRTSHEGLRATLKPQGGRALAPQDLSDFADWLIALHARLEAADVVLPARRFAMSNLPRAAKHFVIVLLPSIAAMLGFGWAVGRCKLLMSGDCARLTLHAIPIALALVIPLVVLIRLTDAEDHRPRSRRARLLGLVATGIPVLVWSSMILVNEYFDTSRPVVHDVEIVSVDDDSKHASISVRGWAEGRETEWFPTPGWLKKQLTEDSRRILVEVHSGALGYEHLTAVELTGD